MVDYETCIINSFADCCAAETKQRVHRGVGEWSSVVGAFRSRHIAIGTEVRCNQAGNQPRLPVYIYLFIVLLLFRRMMMCDRSSVGVHV